MQYLEQHHRKYPPPNTTGQSSTQVKGMFVPEDYDRTPPTKEHWDERILDVDVSCLMRMILEPLPSKHFGEESFELKDNFFTSPYSELTRIEFGYID